MTTRRIAVIYDTSYLAGDFQPIKKFILSRRFSSKAKQGLLGFVHSMVGGKGAENTLHHQPGDLFTVFEVIPVEVMAELEKHFPNEDKGKQVVAGLLVDGALKVELGLDTVVSARKAQQTTEEESETDEKLLRFTERLITYGTKDRYDLAILATEDEALLLKVAELAKAGKAVFGVKAGQITGTRLLHDKITEVANLERPNKVTLEG